MSKTTSDSLSVLDRLAFGSGDMGVGIAMISASMLIYVFHVEVVGISPIDAGWILLAARFIDAITDPLMGDITGKVRTRLGRFRHWIILGALPFGLSIYLMFSTPGSSYAVNLLWAYCTYIANIILFTMVTIPYISLIGVITRDPAERLKANGYRYTMLKTATLLVTTFVPYWVSSNPDALESYAFCYAILGSFAAACLLFCGLRVKERYVIEENAPSFLKQCQSVMRNDQCLILGLAVVLLLVGFIVRATIAYIYAKEFAGCSEGLAIALFMGMWSVGGFFAAIISNVLTARYNKVKVFEYSLYAASVIGVITYFAVGRADAALAIFFYFASCFLSDINTPILWSSIAEAAEYGYRKTGINATGLCMGFISFCQKLGMGIAGPIAGYTLDFIGYVPNGVQTEAALNGLSLAMCFIPALFFFLTALVIRRYVITNEYYRAMIAGDNTCAGSAGAEDNCSGTAAKSQAVRSQDFDAEKSPALALKTQQAS